MCEIFVLKQNKKGYAFSEKAIEDAMYANPDGSGYSVFQHNKDDTYDLIETVHFPETSYATKDATKTSSETGTKVVDRTPLKDKFFIDYLIDKENKKLILIDEDRKENTIGLPLNLTFPFKNDQDELVAVEHWLDTHGFVYDFEGEWQDWEKDLAENFRQNSYATSEQLALPEPTKKFGSVIELRESIVKTLYKRQLKLEKNQLIIMHFRLATIGKTKENIQPIVTEDFLTIHNGVFTGLGSEKLSDTGEFTQNLEALYRFTKLKSKEEEQAFIEAYLKTVRGWYSTFIYSMKTKHLFYFRNGASFYKFADGIMYSTKETRFPIATEAVNTF